MLAAYADHAALVVAVHLVPGTRSPYCARTLDALSFLCQTTINLRQGSLPFLLWRNEVTYQSMWPRSDLFRHRICHILCASSRRFCGHPPIPTLSDFPLSSPVPTDLGSLYRLLVATRLFHYPMLCCFHCAFCGSTILSADLSEA